MAFDPRTSAKQTGYNVGATIVQALATAGLVEDKESAMATLEEVAGKVFADIETTIGEAPTRKAEPAYGGDPGEFRFTSGKHRGRTIAEVAADSNASGYVDWVADKSTGNAMAEAKKQAKAYLDNIRAGLDKAGV